MTVNAGKSAMAHVLTPAVLTDAARPRAGVERWPGKAQGPAGSSAVARKLLPHCGTVQGFAPCAHLARAVQGMVHRRAEDQARYRPMGGRGRNCGCRGV